MTDHRRPSNFGIDESRIPTPIAPRPPRTPMIKDPRLETSDTLIPRDPIDHLTSLLEGHRREVDRKFEALMLELREQGKRSANALTHVADLRRDVESVNRTAQRKIAESSHDWSVEANGLTAVIVETQGNVASLQKTVAQVVTKLDAQDKRTEQIAKDNSLQTTATQSLPPKIDSAANSLTGAAKSLRGAATKNQMRLAIVLAIITGTFQAVQTWINTHPQRQGTETITVPMQVPTSPH